MKKMYILLSIIFFFGALYSTYKGGVESEKIKQKVETKNLKEATKIIRSLKNYGNIHTVKTSAYLDGTHQEVIDRANKWLSEQSKN